MGAMLRGGQCVAAALSRVLRWGAMTLYPPSEQLRQDCEAVGANALKRFWLSGTALERNGQSEEAAAVEAVTWCLTFADVETRAAGGCYSRGRGQ